VKTKTVVPLNASEQDKEKEMNKTRKYDNKTKMLKQVQHDVSKEDRKLGRREDKLKKMFVRKAICRHDFQTKF
jgi:hypothetical protein